MAGILHAIPHLRETRHCGVRHLTHKAHGACTSKEASHTMRLVAINDRPEQQRVAGEMREKGGIVQGVRKPYPSVIAQPAIKGGHVIGSPQLHKI